MNNAELIEVLRYCGADKGCLGCPLDGIASTDCILQVMIDAAAALKAAEHRIEDLEGALAACRARKDGRMPKEGEWIDEQRGRWIYAKCNLCGKVQDVRSNYCPNCGARMKTVTDCHALEEGER